MSNWARPSQRVALRHEVALSAARWLWAAKGKGLWILGPCATRPWETSPHSDALAGRSGGTTCVRGGPEGSSRSAVGRGDLALITR